LAQTDTEKVARTK